MSAISSLPTTYSDNSAAMLALSNQRDQQQSNRAQALQLGKGVQNQEQLETKVREVAEDFVSVFMNQVMKSMRATVQENPAMHGDNGEKFFQDMLDTEQSKELARGSGYGLTDLIYESMMVNYRLQNQGDATQQDDSLYEAEVEAAAEPDLAVAGIA